MGADVTIPPRRDACETITGTYTGDGLDDRDIDVGVDLAARSNVTVIVKAADNTQATFRIEYGQGDLGGHFTADLDGADRIQDFIANGFQIGTRQEVNSNGVVYKYIVFWREP